MVHVVTIMSLEAGIHGVDDTTPECVWIHTEGTGRKEVSTRVHVVVGRVVREV